MLEIYTFVSGQFLMFYRIICLENRIFNFDFNRNIAILSNCSVPGNNLIKITFAEKSFSIFAEKHFL